MTAWTDPEVIVGMTAAIATGAAVGVAFWQTYLARSETRAAELRAADAEARERDRLIAAERDAREQFARRVHFRQGDFGYPNRGWVDLTVIVRNFASEPIFDVQAVTESSPWDLNWGLVETMLAGEEQSITVQLQLPPGTDSRQGMLDEIYPNIPISIYFTDVAGRRWHREPDRSLRQTAPLAELEANGHPPRDGDDDPYVRWGITT